MTIKDADGKIIGSIDFSDKELELEKEKFEKMVELCKSVIISDKELKLNKSDNFHNTLRSVVNSVRDFGLEYCTTNEKSLYHYDIDEQTEM